LLYIAVVGLGSIGKRHIRNCRALFPKHKIIGVSSSGRVASDIDGADIVITDIKRLESFELSLVVIASPASLHDLHLQQLPDHHNCPILIEKPVADSVKHAGMIADFEAQYQGRIAVGYCLRFLPAATVFKDLVDTKKYGKVLGVKAAAHSYLPHWRNGIDYRNSVSAQKKLGGGALLELSHELDYLAWIFGPLSLESAQINKESDLDIDVEDSARLTLKGQNNEKIDLSLSFADQDDQRYCLVECEIADIYWDLLQNKVEIRHTESTVTIYHEPEYDRNNMYLNTLSFLINTNILDDKRQLANVQSAAETVALIEEIKQQGKLN